MDVGIGANNPLSTIISSVFAATRSRGYLLGSVLAFQGWSQFVSLVAAILSLAVVAVRKNAILEAPYPVPKPIDCCWWLLVGLVAPLVSLLSTSVLPSSTHPRFDM
ncbi:hypothetical protein EDC04DRAFT_2897284 [Pisolithus marmoratus]|nr:hypothetical protein EDC04DRAFT_2897284 [Pisolithus marmoratus]